jgi:FkbM family methyltransferase
MYKSQFLEDKILDRIFQDKSNGFCIEIGANDGINDSTTLYFEEKGWDCILVEPNPALCALIKLSRSATLFECAASDKTGDVTLFVAEGSDRSHGVSTIESTDKSLNKIKSYGFTYKEVIVPARKLDDLLVSMNFHGEIDFISIDVEGHELDVLKGFSLRNWNPKIVIVEDNSNFENADVRNYMHSNDYICFKRTGVNDWYAHKSSNELIKFNNIITYYWAMIIGKLKNRIKNAIYSNKNN